MSEPKPYRIEIDNAYAAEGMLARLPERCQRLARVTIATTLTEADLEHVRTEGGQATPLPAESTLAEMNRAIQEMAEALNAEAGRVRWGARDASRLSREKRAALERLVTGHYAAPPTGDDLEARIRAPQPDRNGTTDLLAAYGLGPDDVLINLNE